MTAKTHGTEFWLRGVQIPGVPAPLQPVAHALLQALEDVEANAADLSEADLWAPVGEAASVGFHIVHMGGSLDRLLTYARGEQLSHGQREALMAEKAPPPTVTAIELVARLRTAIDRALDQLRATPPDTLDEPRSVGRSALPSTVRGLLYHAGEHTSRHAGQVITTARILKSPRS